MPRTVWPNAFLLRSCELTEVFANGRAAKIVKEFLPTVPGKHVEPGHEGPPVVLRWATAPHIGFSRVPFEVFRRRPTERYERLVVTLNTAVDTPVEWGLREMYEVRFTVTPGAGATLVVEALDRDHEVIPAQRIVFTAAQVGLFRSPGIAALRVYGTGVISQVLGLDQNELANTVEWERIAVVGFPFAKDEVPPAVYESSPQGDEPPTLDGAEAAKLRLKIAELLHLPLPATGVSNIPTPDWPAPDPARYLEVLRNPKPSAFGLIQECLENTDDTDLARLQMNYIHHSELEGIRQADIPNAAPGPDPADTDLPVVAMTMMALGGDSFGSTALGYGTVDFPPRADVSAPTYRVPPGTVQTPFLYMVTTTLTLPFGVKMEIAALAQACPMPEAAANLAESTPQRNRPPERDLPTSEVVQLSWDLSFQAQGYGALVSRAPNSVEILNASRGESGGFVPFVPQRPEEINGAPPPGTRSTFVDPIAPVPITGTLLSRYLLIGLDVFGRWSGWRLIAHVSPALAVAQPGLHAVTLSPNGAPAGRVVPCSIAIEFSWNWADRSPLRIEFSGVFYSVTAAPPISVTTGFELAASSPLDPNVVVAFPPTGPLSIVSGHDGDVIELDPLPNADPEQHRYRLTLAGRANRVLQGDFTGVSEIGYAVYARAAEKIRPTELSAVVGPAKARLADPIPPIEPVLPVDLRWTALPDAAGRAHAVLSWPAATNAAGYVVWEGTEAALRHAVDPSLSDPAAGTSIFDRARELTALVTAFVTPESVIRATRSMQGFARLNTELIRGTQVELDLPGRADSLYAYRISAVSTSNLESPRSNSVALFAVPRRNQPGQPVLMLRLRKGETNRGIDVIAIPGTAPRTAGFRVYRVRSTALLREVGLMGPPKIEHDDAAWRDIEIPSPRGPVQRGRAILDPVSESWFPYYYRVVALGADDPTRGEFRGESLASVQQSILFPPETPPFLEIETEANTTNRVIRFVTDLPVRDTPAGTARLQVQKISSANGRVTRTGILAMSPGSVPVAPALDLLAAPTQAELDAMPEISRDEPDADGRVRYTVRVRAEVAEGAISVMDALNRITELTF